MKKIAKVQMIVDGVSINFHCDLKEIETFIEKYCNKNLKRFDRVNGYNMLNVRNVSMINVIILEDNGRGNNKRTHS